MNTKRKKIFIITLVVITFFVLLYIVYMFLGRVAQTPPEQSNNKIFDFGSLTLKKKAPVDGSQVGDDTQSIDINGDGKIDEKDFTGMPTDTSGTGNPGQIGGTGIDGSDLPNFDIGKLVPLPDPGINPGSTIPDINLQDIIDINLPKNTDPKQKEICKDPDLSAEMRKLLCTDPYKPGTGDTGIISFTLNDEEQAELDRLNRAFARLAPYLKTEAEIASEQSNYEAYADFTLEAGRLTNETNIEIAGSTYAGQKQRVRPFLTGKEFGDKASEEIDISPLIGTDDKDIPNGVLKAINKFLAKKTIEVFGGSTNSRLEKIVSDLFGGSNSDYNDGTCPGAKKTDNCVSSETFEGKLGIY